jgi:hypothetical protein
MLPEIQVRKRDSFRYSSVYHPSIHHPKNPFGGCEIQSTVREPVRANMYKGVSAAYTIIVMSYWTLAFTGYWAFGSEVHPIFPYSSEMGSCHGKPICSHSDNGLLSGKQHTLFLCEIW